MRYRLCVVLGMLSLASPVGAQDLKQQWAWCLNKDNAFTVDQGMAGCTAVIQANQGTPKEMATAFRSRGNAYADKGQPDRAIEDYDQALLAERGRRRSLLQARQRLLSQGSVRPRHPGLRPGHPAEPDVRPRLEQPRDRLAPQGPA